MYQRFQVKFRNIEEHRIHFAHNQKQLNNPHACCIHSSLLPLRKQRDTIPVEQNSNNKEEYQHNESIALLFFLSRQSITRISKSYNNCFSNSHTHIRHIDVFNIDTGNMHAHSPF